MTINLYTFTYSFTIISCEASYRGMDAFGSFGEKLVLYPDVLIET